MLSMIDEILDSENVCKDGLLVVTCPKQTVPHSVWDFAKFMTTVMWPGNTFQYAGSFKSQRLDSCNIMSDKLLKSITIENSFC